MNTWLSTRAIMAVCRTFKSDKLASASLLRRLLTPASLAERGYEELPRLADEIKHIIPHDPALVADVYIAAFDYKEERTDRISMGPSRILSLTSNMAQDYRMALFHLAEAYPTFAKADPIEATRALISIAGTGETMGRQRLEGNESSSPFSFYGKAARIVEDFSSSWDSGSLHEHADDVRILNAWCTHLSELAEEKPDHFVKVLRYMAEHNTAAAVWRRLLVVGAQHPETVGQQIRELLWAAPILTGLDTGQAARRLLRALFSRLQLAERERIERAILNLASEPEHKNNTAREWRRKQLLGCLSEASLILQETRSARAALTANEIEDDELDESFEFVEMDDWTDLPLDGHLRRGESSHTDSHLAEALTQFRSVAKDVRSQQLTAEALSRTLPATRLLHASLVSEHGEQAGPEVRRSAWSALADACDWLAHLGRDNVADTLYSELAAILIEAANQQELPIGTDEEESFARSPHWSDAYPRVSAAEGLVLLARFGRIGDIDLRATIHRLSSDPRPAVRFQIAAGLGHVFALDRELSWQILEERSAVELNPQVAACLGSFVNGLRRIDADKTVDLAKKLSERFAGLEHGENVRNQCLNVWVNLTIELDHHPSRSFIDELAEDIPRHHADIVHVAAYLRHSLRDGPVEPIDAEADARRERAIALMLQFARAGRAAIERILTEDRVEYSTVEQERNGRVYKAVDDIGMQVYFASGAQDEKTGGAGLVPLVKERFYRELSAVIGEFIAIGLAPTAFHFVEMFSRYVDIDPRGIFLRLERAITVAAQRDGLALVGLAVNAVVEVVSRYLADHRDLLRTDDGCRAALINILDTFVLVGWPQAWQLTYKLGNIDR